MARQCREHLHNGIDPINARDHAELAKRLEAAKQITFARCFEQWTDIQDWDARNLEGVKSRFKKHALPKLGELPIGMINADLLEEVLQPIWKVIPIQADHLLRELIRMFTWAEDAKEYHPGPNPARKVRLRLKPLASFYTVKSHNALPFEEMGPFMAGLRDYATPERRPDRKYEHPLSAYALEFTILLAVRSHQTRELRWDDINERKREWTCKRHKIVKKTKKPFIIPLSNAAWAIIETMSELQARDDMASDYVFAHTFEGNPYYQPKHGRFRSEPLRQGAMRAFLHEGLKRPDLTVHGFRRTFSTWAHETGRFLHNDIEIALGHAPEGSQVSHIYNEAQRVAARRQLLEAWAERCNTIEPLDAKVIPMRAIAQG